MGGALHVFLDALSSCSGGARTWMRALVARLAAHEGVSVTVACRQDQRAGFGLEVLPPSVDLHAVPAAVQGLAARLAYSSGVIPLVAARRDADVLLCPADHAPPVCACAVTLMIRNPTPYAPDAVTGATPRRRARLAAMRAVTLASAWRSQRVILVSEAALVATSAVIPLPLERVRVVHHGRDERFCPPASPASREADLVLAVGTLYAFKNYPVLLDALALLRDRHGRRPRVVIAGAPVDAPHAAWLRARTTSLGLDGQVEWRGEVPHDGMAALYCQAALFVMPSRLETFGHPYVEAMATGTPALVADIPCARELCGDAVAYADPSAPADFAAKMAELLADAALRRRLGERGPARAASFSWDRCADETLGVLQEAREARRGANAAGDAPPLTSV